MFNLTQPYKLTALPWVFNAHIFQFMLIQVILTRVSITMISMTMEISMIATMTRLTEITTVMLAKGRGEDLSYIIMFCNSGDVALANISTFR